MAVLLLAVSGMLLWGIAMSSWAMLGSRLPQSIIIADTSAGMSVSSRYMPVLEGDKPRERSRAVHIFYESPPENLRGRPLPETYYPDAKKYRGMVLVMLEWGGQHHPPTNGIRPRPTWTPSGAMNDPILASQDLAMPYQVGDPLRLKDPKNASNEEVLEWVESWGADWTVPEGRSSSYEIENTPEENVARVLVKNIHSLASGDGISTSAPFSGAETSSFRKTGNVVIQRAGWIMQVYFMSIFLVGAFAVCGIAFWAYRRRRRTRSVLTHAHDSGGFASS